jgi:hypothetical protein
MMRHVLVSIVSLAVSAGCSLPLLRHHHAEAPAALAAGADTASTQPIVQVRDDFQRSSVVSVVAWDRENADFGLRTAVSRNGTLLGGDRFGDHSMYMTPTLVRTMGGFAHAEIVRGQLLRSTGTALDRTPCAGSPMRCSPSIANSIRLPDSLLRVARDSRDSVIVTFYPTLGEPWTLALRPELVTAYLHKVDSVVARMRAVATR